MHNWFAHTSYTKHIFRNKTKKYLLSLCIFIAFINLLYISTKTNGIVLNENGTYTEDIQLGFTIYLY